MDTTRTSGLKEYCIGIVVETKPVGTDMIKVWPSEELSLAKGELQKQQGSMTESMPDSQGNAKTSTVKYGSVIEASWIMGESNRVTAPDVVHGESVIVYRYADTGEYYWRPLYSSEPAIRRKEHVIYGYSNVKDQVGKKEFDAESSYWMMVSTLKQLLHLHTSDNDGEKVKYDIKLNPKDGEFTLEDDLGNKIELLSTESIFRVTNKDGTVFELNEFNCTERCDNTRSTKAKDIKVNAESVTTEVEKDNKSKAENLLFESETFRITAQDIDAPHIHRIDAQLEDHERRIQRLESFH